MPHKLRQPNNNGGIEPLNRHAQFLRRKLFIRCAIQIKILTSCILHSFHVVYLLRHMLEPGSLEASPVSLH